ncbi:type II CRISPR RNA-guided endonuclease Cas9 [Mesomycoplasma ovipneumoniae]|uniref:CRISPR-associated endonuclease Cas9 n=1 Tax=Mesomycoplasma ovipneumoniae TaxID=29562 RepID=A0AAW6Q511_9BACT|nr:type II CRISPR RNA-guided endonuclease Cas9 [Mesomycoplasma ovipneumoniae]MDF9627632.1 type II CRISPR RNA-guided endonuclease Cas9 [Mesomycoplasma ovipneumoniae]MDO4157640.1 type II CRISPR RNA-guided endonuclease Cas9 [Mesomycoplasma ovipneumoniae]MDO4158409.1 type II CRISPR RNA-guided endonuclease Cas9 [Mesomycoplasma ovipneumoniae]MDO6821995.1 type II CRISPR RNA-guided endonuclease Cas9 [Mesomycoplasma ovipneumoniae]MDO6855428.1 type II CRISPR RNA-guided endonuclease Cas9 [Mesomycoplasma 
MNQKKSIAIGFDLGIASVGWAIINSETNEILNWGSRIFKEREEGAAKRRSFRTARRTIRRRQYKSEKLLKLILRSKNIFDFKNIDEIKNSFLKSSSQNSNILDLKIKALNEKIDPKDLAWILHDYLENRGYFYELDDNREKLKYYNGDKFPTQVLNDFFKKNNFFKSSKYNFSNQQWTVEIKKLFEVQNIDEEFQKSFLRLFNYIRDFAKGPGSLHSASEYGIWKFDKEQNKIVQQYDNIWDKTIGKCIIFPNELRASLNFVSYEFFNLLNELSNLRSDFDPEWRLKKEDRDKLINGLLSGEYKNITDSKIVKIIEKDLEIDKDDFKGREIIKKRDDIKKKLKDKTKNTNILIKEITNHSEKYKNFKVENFVDRPEHLEALDSICFVLQKYKEKKDRFIEEINKTKVSDKINVFVLDYFGIINKKDEFINNLLNNKVLTFKKTGSYSAKATRMFVEKMLITQENSEYLKYNDKEINDIIKQNAKAKPLTKYLNSFIFKDEILPPSVKQTFEQAIAVLNKIIKKYSKDYEISGIFIEIPREKNDEEAKKKQANKTVKSGLDEIYEVMNKKYGLEFLNISKEDLYNKPKPDRLLKKLKLYCQQDGVDLYKLDKIKIKDLINSSKYHFEHIIPKAYLPDNSLSNLILTERDQNLKKSNLCAAAYMKSKGDGHYKAYVQQIEKLFNPKRVANDEASKIFGLDTKKVLKKKKLLYQEKIDPHQKEEFLSRQLNDTRYSTKLFLEVVKEHFRDNPNFSYDQATKIFTLNGHQTAFIREKILEDHKDRADNKHHAIDAAIIAIMANKNRHALSSLTIQEGLRQSKYEQIEDGTIINKQTGEILKNSDYDSKKFELVKNISSLVDEKIKNADDKVKIKFSRKMTNYTNARLFKDTLYGLRQNDNGTYDKVEKINLINPKSLKNLKDYFADPNPNSGKYLVLMYQSHKSEFEKLRTIFNRPEFNKKENKNKDKNEKTNKNPFQAYMQWLVSEKYIDEEEKENAIGANKLIYVDPVTNKKTLFKDLKVVTEKNINKDLVFVNKKQGEKSFQTGKKQLFALVYENKEGQLSSVPINFLLKKFGSKVDDRNFYSLDESKYNQENLKKYKDNLGIEHHSKPIIAIKISAIVKLKVDKKISFVSKDNNGDRISESIPIRADDDHYFYISGISKEKGEDTKFTVKSFELKGLEYSGYTNSFLNYFQFVSLDELGNEYESNEQRKLEEYFLNRNKKVDNK